jgi:hypothetical protein
VDLVDIERASDGASVAEQEHAVHGDQPHDGGGTELPGLVPDGQDAIGETVAGKEGVDLLLAFGNQFQGALLAGPEIHRAHTTAG